MPREVEERAEKAKKPSRPPLISRKPISEGLDRQGNAMTEAIFVELLRDGKKPTIERTDTGYWIKIGNESALIRDSFERNDQDQRSAGSSIDVQSLRLPWFRNMLMKVLGFENEGEMYRALTTNKFFAVQWNAEYPLSVSSLNVFDDKTLKELAAARAKIKLPVSALHSYISGVFSKYLPSGYAIGGAYDMNLYAVTPEALLSVVSKNGSFKEAVSGMEKAAKEIIEDSKDVPKLMKKLYNF